MHKPKLSGKETQKRHRELMPAHQKAFELWQANRDIEGSDLHKQLKLAGFIVASETVRNWRARFNRGVFPRKEESKRVPSPPTPPSTEEIVAVWLNKAFIAALDKVREENKMLKDQIKTLDIEIGSLKARCELAETRIREDFRAKLSKALAESGEG